MLVAGDLRAKLLIECGGSVTARSRKGEVDGSVLEIVDADDDSELFRLRELLDPKLSGNTDADDLFAFIAEMFDCIGTGGNIWRPR